MDYLAGFTKRLDDLTGPAGTRNVEGRMDSNLLERDGRSKSRYLNYWISSFR